MIECVCTGRQGPYQERLPSYSKELWLIPRGDDVGGQGGGLNDWKKGLRWCDLHSRKNTLEAISRMG